MSEIAGHPTGAPRIPGYEILRLIGSGGMGDVYLAKQVALGRLVAIKCLKSDFGSATSEPFLRFRREAELMARVNHPHVLSAFDFGMSEGRPYLVMEYVAGGDLRQLMTAHKPMGLKRALTILRPVADALACLHRNELLHRDLKPENILLHSEAHPKVADFGISVLRSGVSNLTGTQVGLGSLGYAAPEQRFGLTVGEAADQYSLAAVAYEMLTGHAALGVIRPPSRHNREIGANVDAVLMRALAEDPSERFEDVPKFLEALERADQRDEVESSRRINHPAIVVAVAVFCAAIAFAGWRMFVGGHDRSVARADEAKRDPVGHAPVPDRARAADEEAEREPMPADPLTAFIAEHIDRRAYLRWQSHGKPPGTEKSDWLAALDELFGTGSFARAISEGIESSAHEIWKANGRPPDSALKDWSDAKAAFMVGRGLVEAIDGQVKVRAHQIWQQRGEPKDQDKENWYAARRQLLFEGTILPREIDTRSAMTLVFVAGDEAKNRPPFYLAVTEVTRGQFQQFVADASRAQPRGDLIAAPDWVEPGYSGGVSDAQPIVGVAWTDADEFCAWLGAQDEALYSVPPEQVWEVAVGEPAEPIDVTEWVRSNADGHPHSVGSKPANAHGFHDLIGNVREWCLGRIDGQSFTRPIRGGSWETDVVDVKSLPRETGGVEFRSWSVGFRVCRAVWKETGLAPPALAEVRH